jgi:hypothetical protein
MTYAVYMVRTDNSLRQLSGGSGFGTFLAAWRWLERHGGAFLPCDEGRYFPETHRVLVWRHGVRFLLWPEGAADPPATIAQLEEFLPFPVAGGRDGTVSHSHQA